MNCDPLEINVNIEGGLRGGGSESTRGLLGDLISV